MKTKVKLIILIINVLTVSIMIGLSMALFTSIDKTSNNYIHIGKILRHKVTPKQDLRKNYLSGQVYKYSIVEKKRFTSYEEWLTSVSKNILKKEFNIGKVQIPLSLRKLMFFDKNFNYTQYATVFFIKDLDTNKDFYFKNAILEINNEKEDNVYNYEDIKQYIKPYKYYKKGSYFITGTNYNSVTAIVLDLTELLKEVINSERVEVKLITNQGYYFVKIK